MAERFLYKYIGLKEGMVRTDFLNGLFRFTQPNQLNDPHEVYPEILVNTYSPEDLERARDEARKIGIPEDEIESKLPMFLAVGIHSMRELDEYNAKKQLDALLDHY